jgi:predicted dehydrogenase
VAPDRVRIGVVGVGALGRHHARILASMPTAEFVGVADTASARAAEVAGMYGVAAFTEPEALLGRVDAVTLAAPTEVHHALAVRFLDEGVHVLVEKPMTTTLGQADDLIARAAARQVRLAVGHTERFNPAVDAALPFLTRPRFIEVHRLGTFPDRSLDIDVVFDLMIHDLDLLLATLKQEVVGLEAVGVPVLTDRVDIANARLRFADGCIANLTASRISRDRVRKIRFIEPASYVSVDYASRELEVWRLRRSDGGRPAIEGGPVAVPDAEPLRLELEDFVDAIRQGRAPRVPGEQGRLALALAQRINDEMTRG